MQDQPTRPPFPPDDVTDGEIMTTLLVSEPHLPWSVAEIVRDIGCEIVVTDSLNRLHGGGLIHRLDGFVFPTRAALCSHQLAR